MSFLFRAIMSVVIVVIKLFYIFFVLLFFFIENYHSMSEGQDALREVKFLKIRCFSAGTQH